MDEYVITVIPKQIIFHSTKNDYVVLLVEFPDTSDEFIVTGNFINIQLGEEIRFGGTWAYHEKYGEQFAATEVWLQDPQDLDIYKIDHNFAELSNESVN